MSAKILGDIKVQCDRWPLNEKKKTEHVLTIIIVGAFTEKPTQEDIARACEYAAAKILRATPEPW
jgi:hypothetical protein